MLVVAVVFSGAKAVNVSQNRYGVVLEKKVEVKSGYSGDSVTLFQLNEGAIVTLSGYQGDWVQIKVSEDKKGWVKKSKVGD